MARYEFTEDWPRGIIRRDILVYREGESRWDKGVAISPPDRSVDIGEYPPGTRLRLVINSAHGDGTFNKQAVEKFYTIPEKPEVEDTAAGRLTEWGVEAPESSRIPARSNET